MKGKMNQKHLYNNFYEGDDNGFELKFKFQNKNSYSLNLIKSIIPYIVEKKIGLPRGLIISKYRDGEFSVFVKINGKIYPVFTNEEISDELYAYEKCVIISEKGGIFDKYRTVINGLEVVKLPKDFPYEVLMEFL